MVDRTEDLPTLLARIPDLEIRSLFTPEFILCSEEFDRFTVDTVVNLVRELGLEEGLERGTSVPEVLAERGWAPAAEIPVTWFFRKLAAEGHVEVTGSGPAPVFRSRGPLPVGDPDRAEARARALDPRSAPPFASATAHFASSAFRRGKEPRAVLLSDAALPPDYQLPGIPFLPPQRARELIAIYHLH